MMTITLDKNILKREIYLLTAAKSRFMHKDGMSPELNTFDYEEPNRENLAEFSGTHTNITVSESLIPNTGHNVVTLDLTAGASTSGTCEIKLNGTIFVVELPDTFYGDIEITASFIRSWGFNGWETSGEGSKIIFTELAFGVSQSAPTFVCESAGVVGAITASNTSNVSKAVSFAYPIANIKAEIALLTKQKGRNVTDSNGLSLMDRIAFTGKTATALTVTPDKAAVFSLCKSITAKRGTFLANDTVRFENVVLTSDDEALFGSFYTKAFSDLLGQISPMLDSYVADTSFTITAGFIGTVSTGLKPTVESYLKSSCLAQFYSIVGAEKDVQSNSAEALAHLAAINNMLTAQADADALLKSIITDAALKAQTALYPLSKKADGSLTMYEYGATNITFKFELKEIPISSSAIQLLYNLVQSILINGAQAKWYTMAGISDDKNEAKKELETNLASIAFIVEDRLRFVGLFDQLFDAVSMNIRQRLLAYTKDLTVDSYSVVDNIASFNFEIPDWEAEPTKMAYIENLAAAIKDAELRGILAEWWRISGNEEYSSEMEKLATAFMAIKVALELRHTPVRRSVAWM